MKRFIAYLIFAAAIAFVAIEAMDNIKGNIIAHNDRISSFG